jgi:glycine/serine hydroxymethyltransferase
MKQTNSGGSAFPVPVAFTPMGTKVSGGEGMTLRDYFAAKALPIAAALEIQGHEYHERVAMNAYYMADAMLAARGAA